MEGQRKLGSGSGRLVHPQVPPAPPSASSSLSGAMFALAVPSDASTRSNIGTELSLRSENTLRRPCSHYFLGAQEDPIHHRLPWGASVGLSAVANRTLGVTKQAQKGTCCAIPFV